MTTIKVGVREFRERIASFLESDTPVAVTRRGETLGVYVPTRRKRPKTADISELKAAADRLAELLADIDEKELVTEFKELRQRGRRVARETLTQGESRAIRRGEAAIKRGDYITLEGLGRKESRARRTRRPRAKAS
jgi:hypothetical protein